jgi:thiamine biosynthesis protein ThiI
MFFERKLITNLRKLTGKRVIKRDGRLVISDHVDPELLVNIPGIEYFGIGVQVNYERIFAGIDAVLRDKNFSTFKISAKRYDKSFPKTSMDLNKELGSYVVERYGKSVSLKNPDVIIYVEVCRDGVYVYADKYAGPGGLPVSTQGKVVSLLSGGIDSPVASFLMMKRGCEVVFTHFYNRTLHTKESLKKVEKIVEELTGIQLSSKLYLVPFYDIQKEIISYIPAKYRMLVYRRSMVRIANLIAKNEDAKTIVTGDSLGQVASQTLDNLVCVHAISELPVLSPLISFNKTETIELAKKIGTYELSILPYEDCCSFMIARHPETRGNPETLSKLESFISNLSELEETAFRNAEIREFVYR